VESVIIPFYSFHRLSEHSQWDDILPEIHWFEIVVSHLYSVKNLKLNNVGPLSCLQICFIQTITVFRVHLAGHIEELIFISNILQKYQIFGI